MQALHDNSITQALTDVLGREAKVVAIMGGHNMVRGAKEYRDIVKLRTPWQRRAYYLLAAAGPALWRPLVDRRSRVPHCHRGHMRKGTYFKTR